MKTAWNATGAENEIKKIAEEEEVPDDDVDELEQLIGNSNLFNEEEVRCIKGTE